MRTGRISAAKFKRSVAPPRPEAHHCLSFCRATFASGREAPAYSDDATKLKTRHFQPLFSPKSRSRRMTRKPTSKRSWPNKGNLSCRSRCRTPYEASRLNGYVHLGITPGHSGINGRRNFFEVQSNNRPPWSAQHHRGYSAASEVFADGACFHRR
jgi:hypothetical protein